MKCTSPKNPAAVFWLWSPLLFHRALLFKGRWSINALLKSVYLNWAWLASWNTHIEKSFVCVVGTERSAENTSAAWLFAPDCVHCARCIHTSHANHLQANSHVCWLTPACLLSPVNRRLVILLSFQDEMLLLSVCVLTAWELQRSLGEWWFCWPNKCQSFCVML